MGFREDLERWTAKEIARSAGPRFLKNLLRILRGSEAPTLRPVDAEGFPSEQIEATPPSRDIAPPAAIFDWLCWPSSDGAVHGWGDPYENPPGTPVNPPLGTIQTSFDDVSLIARELTHTDSVTHGVNKIAALRDWRDTATPLVLSWDDNDIYSGGSSIKTGTSIVAACVRYTGGTPYLLWAETSSSPSRIWSQECTIVDDIVTGVTGGTSYATFDIGSVYWSEFSQDGNSFVACFGIAPKSRSIWTMDVPVTFSSQVLTITKVGEPSAYDINWVNSNSYTGMRSYPIKSQYVDNVLKHARIEVTIKRGTIVTDTDFVTLSSLGMEDGEVYRCGSACPGGTDLGSYEINPPGGLDDNDGYRRYEILTGFSVDVELKIDADVIHQVNLATDGVTADRWCITDEGPGGGCGTNVFTQLTCVHNLNNPAIPGPDGVDWPCKDDSQTANCCVPKTYKDISGEILNYQLYQGVPQETFDIRHARYAVIDLGDSDDNGATKNKKLQYTLCRRGFPCVSGVREGNYGFITVTTQGSISTEASLKTQIDLTAERFNPVSATGITGGGRDIDSAALDLSLTRAVQWIRAKSEDDGLYDHINLLEDANIEGLLSISGETEPRIVIHASDRYFGLLKQDQS